MTKSELTQKEFASKGGKARMAKLTKQERSELSKKGVLARLKKKNA